MNAPEFYDESPLSSSKFMPNIDLTMSYYFSIVMVGHGFSTCLVIEAVSSATWVVGSPSTIVGGLTSWEINFCDSRGANSTVSFSRI